MKFYQTLQVRDNVGCDEFIQYEGYDKEEAVNTAIRADGYLTDNERKNGNYIEVREFEIEKKWDEYTEDEQCDIICRGYNLVSFNEIPEQKLDTPDRLAEAAGVSRATVYNRAKELGRLPTVEELQRRKATGKAREDPTLVLFAFIRPSQISLNRFPLRCRRLIYGKRYGTGGGRAFRLDLT